MSETCLSYRSAIALNNIGVSLLERRCFQAASETLKDATALIKSTLRDGQTSRGNDIEQMVFLARQRLSDAVNKDCNGRERIQVEVFTANNLRSKSIGHFSEEAPPGKVYAILIEDFDSKGANKESLTAILLFNLGVAYYSVSKAAKLGKSSNKKAFSKYSNGALRLFRIAHSLFSKKVSNHNAETNHVPEPLHVMALVVLSTLIIRTLSDYQRHAEARPFHFLLQHLRFWTLNETAIGFTNGAAPAA